VSQTGHLNTNPEDI